MRKRLVTARDIEAAMDVRAGWLVEQARRGRVPALQLGGAVFWFELGAVRRALADMAAQGTRFLRETSPEPLSEGGRDGR